MIRCHCISQSIIIYNLLLFQRTMLSLFTELSNLIEESKAMRFENVQGKVQGGLVPLIIGKFPKETRFWISLEYESLLFFANHLDLCNQYTYFFECML